ncbi:hypothetical protein ACIF8T_03215 [Streptomyces sp. NPDC085946]|uniref:hypothetical protein n=1 Tax=Streptomyces sp. NPDC085946 TaxID=3365744 RepID=UPI0037D0BCE7
MIIGLGLSALCALGAAVALAGVVAMALPGRPLPWPEHLMRRAAWLAFCAAASVYLLGFFGVLASEAAFGDGAGSVPAPACQEGFAPETVRGLSHHRSSYLPLRFDCVREDGSSYPSDPDYSWMNQAAFLLALSGALLALAAAYTQEWRVRGAGR